MVTCFLVHIASPSAGEEGDHQGDPRADAADVGEEEAGEEEDEGTGEEEEDKGAGEEEDKSAGEEEGRTEEEKRCEENADGEEETSVVQEHVGDRHRCAGREQSSIETSNRPGRIACGRRPRTREKKHSGGGIKEKEEA